MGNLRKKTNPTGLSTDSVRSTAFSTGKCKAHDDVPAIIQNKSVETNIVCISNPPRARINPSLEFTIT